MARIYFVAFTALLVASCGGGGGDGGGGSLQAARVVLALDPLYRYLVATNVGAASQTVTAFAIDAASGTLAHVPGSPFSPTVGALPLGVTFDPSGQFAYLADAQTSSISAYRIGANGALTFVGSYAIGASPLALSRIAGLQ